MRRREQDSGLLDEVIGIYFHTKVTKGGRNLTCAALVAVGDGEGRVGLGYSKASGVPAAIEKGTKEGRDSMIEVELVGDTIVHEIVGRHGSARVLLRPASTGTGVKAGSTVRSIMRVAGVRNVLSKVFGNTNALNVAKATMNALERLRSVEEVRRLRGVEVELHHPQLGRPARQEPAPAEEEPEGAETAEAAEAAESATQ
jgi:small subunit ribosomal protein S5